MTIEERIQFHMKYKEEWQIKAEQLKKQLNNANQKIIHHWAAIQNLAIKKSKLKKEYL